MEALLITLLVLSGVGVAWFSFRGAYKLFRNHA